MQSASSASPETGRAAALCAVALLSGCLAVSPLPEHRPLTPTGESGIVYGRIGVKADGATAPPTNPGADWSATGLALRPELRFYLERIAPRRITLPPVTGTGLFAWSLDPGDYLLIALPEEDVGAEPHAQHFRPVAALRVPRGGPWCAGALEVTAPGPVVLDRGPLRVEPVLQQAAVIDRCAEIAVEVAGRYAALTAPVAVHLMVAIDDLAFEDAQLFAEARRRLDAAAGMGAH
jgi:hypothetical protein